jgi:hypothetical protein
MNKIWYMLKWTSLHIAHNVESSLENIKQPDDGPEINVAKANHVSLPVKMAQKSADVQLSYTRLTTTL